jgi:hypothetical protein
MILKILLTFLIMTFSTITLISMEQQHDEACSVEEKVPLEIWQHISQYLSGNDSFLNRDLIRHLSFSKDIYDCIVECYVKTLPFYPSLEEIHDIIQRNFNTSHDATLAQAILHKNIEDALKRYIALFPYGYLLSFLKKRDMGELHSSLRKEFDLELEFSVSDTELSEKIEGLRSKSLFALYKTLLNHQELLKKCENFLFRTGVTKQYPERKNKVLLIGLMFSGGMGAGSTIALCMFLIRRAVCYFRRVTSFNELFMSKISDSFCKNFMRLERFSRCLGILSYVIGLPVICLLIKNKALEREYSQAYSFLDSPLLITLKEALEKELSSRDLKP